MRLKKDSALAALARLDQTLAPADLADLRKIAEALDANTDDTSVATVLARLYAGKRPEALNKAFERLRARLVEAAKSAGLALRLEVRGAKKHGGERRVAFHGEVPIAATADMREIEEARSSGPLIEQEATPLPQLPVVVVLTVNENETQAVLDAFLGEGKQPAPIEKDRACVRRARHDRRLSSRRRATRDWAADGVTLLSTRRRWAPDVAPAVGARALASNVWSSLW